MPQQSDLGGKRLVGLAPGAWARWVTGDPRVTADTILDPGFQWIGRQNDVLIHTNHPDVGEFLIPNEIQLHYHSRVPQRMRAYAALAEEKYNLPAYPVLINILQPGPGVTIPDPIESGCLDRRSLQ